MKSIKQFGEFDNTANYIARPGSYGIIFNNDKLIAVIKTFRGFHLPGGGQDEGESLNTTLKREVVEEIGFEITNIEKLCIGGQYCFTSDLNKHLNKIEHFFVANLSKYKANPVEKDHQLVWTTLKSAESKLLEDCQKWAIKQVISRSEDL